ncbi:LysR family transcriptional regulator [Azospirillum sp. YIM B02556]|uniref:LysR family transcriptional regulator n=1 Tax=Azospirillum endophyticum TaxID=2800326 RepID=A0ABS1F4X1_9PROT|nr:LysR family transcriptional regulator [Azospirillum endophyticum]MBK1838485.1 LysR family transcriptional regulator [Azospirillum endophyticum]
MNATALRYFLEVVRTGSIADASARLHVASSAISRQIAHLEADLGVDLFERRPRGMVPSYAGDLLARHAQRVFLEEEAIVTELKGLRGLASGRVRVAATEGFGMSLVPAAIHSFRDRHPGIRIELHVDAPAAVTRMVREGEVDIGATFSFAPEPGVTALGEGRAPVLAVMAKDHPLADRPVLSLAQLAREPMALPQKNTTVRQLFDIACGQAGVVIEPVLVSNYIAGLWAFAAEGGGITIASPFTVHSSSVGHPVASVPIDSPTLDQRYYQIQTMLDRHLPEAVFAFATHLTGIIQRLEHGPERPGDASGQEVLF